MGGGGADGALGGERVQGHGALEAAEGRVSKSRNLKAQIKALLS